MMTLRFLGSLTNQFVPVSVTLDFFEILTKPRKTFFKTLWLFRKPPVFSSHDINIFHRAALITRCDIIF